MDGKDDILCSPDPQKTHNYYEMPTFTETQPGRMQTDTRRHFLIKCLVGWSTHVQLQQCYITKLTCQPNHSYSNHHSYTEHHSCSEPPFL